MVFGYNYVYRFLFYFLQSSINIYISHTQYFFIFILLGLLFHTTEKMTQLDSIEILLISNQKKLFYLWRDRSFVHNIKFTTAHALCTWMHIYTKIYCISIQNFIMTGYYCIKLHECRIFFSLSFHQNKKNTAKIHLISTQRLILNRSQCIFQFYLLFFFVINHTRDREFICTNHMVTCLLTAR